MQLTQSLFTDEYDDLADLTDNERATARNWQEDFRGTVPMRFDRMLRCCLLLIDFCCCL
jgi:hypothetical protein